MYDRILRLPEVMHKTGISRSSIYAQIQRGTFPKQIQLGTRMVGWSEAAIDSYLSELIDSQTGKEQ
jgi:prophage regulatory protein